MNLPSLILAIESAIAGGSLAILDTTGREIASWVGDDDAVARAEDVILNLNDLLRSSGVSKKDLGLIAVSAGPGSFTGIRIGIATALGLKSALGIPVSSVSALEAMAASGPLDGAVVAVPMGRNMVCSQRFSKGAALGSPVIQTEEAFVATIHELGVSLVLHHVIYSKLDRKGECHDIGSNIALSIGRLARQRPDVFTEPLFISKGL